MVNNNGMMPKAIDLSHHINHKSKSRHPSPLKDIIKYMSQDGMVSLAGGLPHPSLFALDCVTFECPNPSGLLPESPGLKDSSTTLSFSRNGQAGDVQLDQFIQYGENENQIATTEADGHGLDAYNILGTGAGNAQLVALTRQLTDRLHSPLYRYDCLLHPGNTNAWAKVVGLLCEENDNVICDEYVYPSAQALWTPLGIKAVPVVGDAEGMRADKLDDMLASWESNRKNGKRPSLLYLVPVGSNPTGVSISAERRKQIYEVCVKHDIIIVEDDPYYALQYSAFKPGSSGVAQEKLPIDQFVASLIPSFLSIDRQGRVIRLESFSKTLFPGLRLGYFIANPAFTERLLRATEVETQDPAGLSQLFVLGLLQQWTIDGYLLWLQGLQSQYRERRDWLVRAIERNFDLIDESEHPSSPARKYKACVRSQRGEMVTVFRFVDPTAGMFLWAHFLLRGISRFSEIKAADTESDPEQAFATEFWHALNEEQVLLTPGSYYHPWQGPEFVSTSARGAEPDTCEFRFSFATPTKEQIELGIQRLRRVVGRYWH